ncbi:hypothetical protein ONS95_007158 [Cadophora gregata]|uniref:uncharacterized protein n=1 Tax=Cadophora gregata TaxID=51156 RepID=UPI0026DD1F12|nr:uncharacterized protein ONS95_007158 [Cadophora gregata]KAK0100707.1 hypothetical protein ONS95_007158 [Cadophora gregata]KAK0117296.1 hypothetical protein ONS96_013129 [Cadophora gregata f. sp. sojae]
MAVSESISETEVQTNFARFPKLPLELREEIFSYQLPGPRVVEIVERNIPASTTQPVENHLDLLRSSIGSFNTPPILLSISKESRALFKRKYRLAFEHILVHPVYINFKIDVVACTSTTVWTTFMTMALSTGQSQIEFDPITTLALPAPTTTYDSRALVGLALQAAMDFPGLKKLMMIEPRMYWAQLTQSPVVALHQEELSDLITLHLQISFRGVDRGEHWKACEVEILTECALRSRYPDV